MNLLIEIRDPQDLRLHRLQKILPDPERDSTEWGAFVESLRNGDILYPLLITPDNQIMDGGWRWRGAKQLQFPEVPCIVRPEGEAALIIVDSLLHRKQMTRGAAVYLGLNLLKEFVDAAEICRLGNLRRGVKTGENPLKVPKASNYPFGADEAVDELCSRWGISHETYRRARQVHGIFAADPDLKAHWEPRLLSGEKNLWNVLSAVGGAGTDQSRRAAGVDAAQLDFWDSPFAALKNAAPAWKKLDEAKRDAVLADWRKAALKLPADLRAGMKKILEELE